MSAILGYARISTGGQDLEGQRIRLTKAGAARIFEDTISGAKFTRPGLEQLLRYARPGDTIIVVRLDRLGRSLRDLLHLVDRIREKGIALHSLEERIDTASPGGNLIMQVFAALAEFERNLIGTRTRDGLAAARARGARVGKPPRDPKKVEAALLLIDGGMPVTEAAKAVGLGRSTVYQSLQERPLNRPVRQRSAGGPEAKAATKPRTRRGKGSKPPAE